MAALFTFGGTNGVPNLSIGLRGATPDTGSIIGLRHNAASETQQQAFSPPGVNFTAVQRQGLKSQLIIGRGYLKAPEMATMWTYKNALTAASGRKSRLVDNVLARTLNDVLLEDWSVTAPQFKQSPEGQQVQEIEIRFRNLKP